MSKLKENLRNQDQKHFSIRMDTFNHVLNLTALLNLCETPDVMSISTISRESTYIGAVFAK